MRARCSECGALKDHEPNSLTVLRQIARGDEVVLTTIEARVLLDIIDAQNTGN